MSNSGQGVWMNRLKWRHVLRGMAMQGHATSQPALIGWPGPLSLSDFGTVQSFSS
jgi:hypothetical protein